MSNDMVSLHFGFPIGATGATGANGSDGQDGTDNMNVSLKYRKRSGTSGTLYHGLLSFALKTYPNCRKR